MQYVLECFTVGSILWLIWIWRHHLPYSSKKTNISSKDKNSPTDSQNNTSSAQLDNKEMSDDSDLVKEVVTITSPMTRIVFEKNFGTVVLDEKGRQTNLVLQSLDNQIISDYFKNCFIKATKIVLLSRKHTLDHGYEVVVEYQIPKKTRIAGTGLKCEICIISGSYEKNPIEIISKIFKLLDIEIEQILFGNVNKQPSTNITIEYWPKDFDLDAYHTKQKQKLTINSKALDIKEQIYNQYLDTKTLYPVRMQLCESIEGYFDFEIVNES